MEKKTSATEMAGYLNSCYELHIYSFQVLWQKLKMSIADFLNAIKQLEGRDKVLLIHSQSSGSTAALHGQFSSQVPTDLIEMILDMAALEKPHLYCANKTTNRADLDPT